MIGLDLNSIQVIYYKLNIILIIIFFKVSGLFNTLDINKDGFVDYKDWEKVI